MRRLAVVVAVLAAAAPGCDRDPSIAAEGAPRELPRIDAVRIRTHLAVLQRIADANGGTRSTGTPGYDASVRYVVNELRNAGYAPTLHRFTTVLYRELRPPDVRLVAPGDTDVLEGEEIVTMQYSPSGRAEGDLVGVDLRTPPGLPDSSTSGCEPSDFEEFPAGAVALVQRGGCFLFQKAANAAASGAAAALVMNEGQPGRREAIVGTLVSPRIEIPVVGISYRLGERLARVDAGRPVRVRVATRTEIGRRSATNVIADLKGSSRRRVVLGAHLDSVPNGPGLNDNGSGVAAVLEVARELRRKRPASTGVRFAFWAAEELGLRGSTAFVDELSAGERDRIAAVVNLDMVGSPNGAAFVYDGDGSSGGDRAPGSSDELERLFTRALALEGIAAEDTPMDQNSDHAPFAQAGIPVSGLFTGADGVKTRAEAKRFGGASGAPYDGCYHRGCDVAARVDVESVVAMARATTWVVETLTQSR